jgi:VanZ family protein
MVPALAYASGIFYGGVIDIGPLPQVPALPTDKVLHAGAFMGLELLLEFAFWDRSPDRRRVLAILLAAALGGALELVQACLPYRSAEWLDFVADVSGALIGAALCALLAGAAERWLGSSSTRLGS